LGTCGFRTIKKPPSQISLGQKLNFCGTTPIGASAHSFHVLHTCSLGNGWRSRQALLLLANSPKYIVTVSFAVAYVCQYTRASCLFDVSRLSKNYLCNLLISEYFIEKSSADLAGFTLFCVVSMLHKLISSCPHKSIQLSFLYRYPIASGSL